MTEKNVEKLIGDIGKPGRFQVLLFFILAINISIVLWNHLGMVFYAAKTKHHCKIDSDQKIEDVVPVVMRNNEKQWDGCHVYAGNNTTETIPCSNGWTYYLEDREVTIISEFDLVCDDAYKADLATTIYFAGVLFGGLVFGALADRYGRKPVIGFTLFASGAISLAICIFRTYIVFILLRFCLGFIMQGLQISCFVLLMEQFSVKYRGHAGILFGLLINFCGVVFGLVAYLVKDWKYIQLTASVASFIELFMSLCFVPESIRWLMLHGKLAQAEVVIKRTVTFNKLPFPHENFGEITSTTRKESNVLSRQRRSSIVDVFRSRHLRRISFILINAWFTVSASFYGLSFNISYLFGNKYFNFIISVVSDVMLIFVSLWATSRFGRRRTLALGFFLTALTTVTCSITTAMATGAGLLTTVTALFGKACVAATMNLIFVTTSELYPTVVRNISLGMNTFWARVGAMAAPQIFFLGLSTFTFVPYAIVGALNLLTSFLILLLPETQNKSLADKMELSTHCIPSFDKDELDGMVGNVMIHETSL